MTAHPTPDLVLLYVADTLASTSFYTRLLGQEPVEASAGFALFVLPSGLKLGLWKAAAVQPAAGQPGGGELAFELADEAALRALHAQWQQQGLPIAQAPVAMDFGVTFVACDPDGHRLRAFAPHPA